MKGFILAAGFGTRLWPLTEDRTKPAIPFLNRPLIIYSVEYLASHGVRDIIVNLHHQPDSIRRALGDGSHFGVNISYSFEEEILGTSGALDRARESLLDDDFVVINGKIVTDINLTEVISEHRKRSAIATLVLRENSAREHFSMVEVDDRSWVTHFAGFPVQFPHSPRSAAHRTTNEAGGDKQTTQVFLCYAREDEKAVLSLYERLLAAGFKPWMDQRDILPGEQWEYSIEQAILRSHFFLACISHNSVSKRGFLQKEIKSALSIWQEKLHSDIYLIPLRLLECVLPASLAGFYWVDLFRKDGFIRLTEAIKAGTQRRSLGEAKDTKMLADPLMFTGIQVLSPRILEYIPRDRFSHSTIHVYPQAIEAGEPVIAHVSAADWYEMSTLARYLGANLSFAYKQGRSVIAGGGCVIEYGANVADCVLWDRVIVERGARVSEAVLTDDVRIPAGAVVERAVVVRRDNVREIERGEIVGDNLVVPI